MRWILTLFAVFSLVVSTGCPRRGGARGGGEAAMPEAVRTYAALRWVPPDASYAFVGKSTADLSLLLRELAGLAGIPGDFDVADVSRELTGWFGYDMLTPKSLESIGIDIERGGAIFSTGLSPTAAVALRDPAQFEAFVEGWREKGVSIQSRLSNGVEVFTLSFDPDVLIHWAVIDGWVLAHAELTTERETELAWFERAVAARGALGAHADYAAAVEAARTHATALTADGAPPVLGVIRPGAVVDAFERFAPREAIACLGAPLRDASRMLVAAGVGDAGASGSLVADLASADRFATNVLPAPAGWYGVRGGAPLQVDLGLDVVGFARTLDGCPTDTRELEEMGVRTAHVAVHGFDRDGYPSRAVAYADLSSDAFLRAQTRQIPGTFRKTRKVGDLEIVDVDVPMFFEGSYHLTATRIAAAMGDGLVEAVLATGGSPVGGEVLHLELRPGDIPNDAWDLALDFVGIGRGDARARTVQRLRRWSVGTVDVRLDGARLVLTAAGTYRR